MTIVAIIPARGGSKGIEGKNLLPIGVGAYRLSLVARSIRHARWIPGLESVWVTTDDVDIMAEASEHGARVIKRPDELATDDASTDDALIHAIGKIRSSGRDPSIVVTLQPTSPFRQQYVMEECVQKCPSFSAYESHQFDWSQGYPHEGGRKMRQQRVARIIENGSVYVTRVADLMATGSRVSPESRPVICLGLAHSIEIDTPRDYQLAHALQDAHDLTPGDG